MNLNDIFNADGASAKAFIQVTGSYLCGKEEFINQVSDSAVTAAIIPHWIETVEIIDFIIGRIAVPYDLTLFLLGTPGCAYVEYSALSPEWLGTIVVVDSTKPETFRETKSICETLRRYSPPYVVAANHQNHPEAWSIDDLRMALRFRENEMVLPLVATEKKSATQTLLALLEAAPHRVLVEPIIAQISEPDSHSLEIVLGGSVRNSLRHEGSLKQRISRWSRGWLGQTVPGGSKRVFEESFQSSKYRP